MTMRRTSLFGHLWRPRRQRHSRLLAVAVATALAGFACRPTPRGPRPAPTVSSGPATQQPTAPHAPHAVPSPAAAQFWLQGESMGPPRHLAPTADGYVALSAEAGPTRWTRSSSLVDVGDSQPMPVAFGRALGPPMRLPAGAGTTSSCWLAAGSGGLWRHDGPDPLVAMGGWRRLGPLPWADAQVEHVALLVPPTRARTKFAAYLVWTARRGRADTLAIYAAPIAAVGAAGVELAHPGHRILAPRRAWTQGRLAAPALAVHSETVAMLYVAGRAERAAVGVAIWLQDKDPCRPSAWRDLSQDGALSRIAPGPGPLAMPTAQVLDIQAPQLLPTAAGASTWWWVYWARSAAPSGPGMGTAPPTGLYVAGQPMAWRSQRLLGACRQVPELGQPLPWGTRLAPPAG